MESSNLSVAVSVFRYGARVLRPRFMVKWIVISAAAVVLPGIAATAAATKAVVAALVLLSPAVGVGAIDVGLQSLRRAATGAEEVGDTGLQAAALLALGSALVHAARSRARRCRSPSSPSPRT